MAFAQHVIDSPEATISGRDPEEGPQLVLATMASNFRIKVSGQRPSRNLGPIVSCTGGFGC